MHSTAINMLLYTTTATTSFSTAIQNPGWLEPIFCSTIGIPGIGIPGTKGGTKNRHDSIRDRLYQLLKQLNPGIQQTHLRMEFVVGQVASPDEPLYTVRTDIKFIEGADTFYIDVAIVVPAAAEFQMPPTRSHLTQDGVRMDEKTTLRQSKHPRRPPIQIHYPLRD